ncbi:MAG: hypothetical protein R3330_07040, partial [Saprospiraceae bacterium]|nr:hypothetical protein [Saprospiraceae bacterium]
MPEVNSEIIQVQVAPSAIQSSRARTGTDLVLPPMRIADRLRHFSENVYDISPESHLVRFIKVLIGDAGAGRLRKRFLVQRLRHSLQGSHFYDLDRFYGPLFGIIRTEDETLGFDPYKSIALRDDWDDVYARDSSFRSRIEQLARAIPFGATPVGMELIAEAILASDCEIYESFIQADQSYQTYQELEDQFAVLLNSDNMASIETDITDWNVETNCTLAQSSSWAIQDGFTAGGGTNSLELTSVAAGNMGALSDLVTGLTAGVECTFAVVWNGTVDRQFYVEVDWYNSTPTLIDTDIGSPVNGTAGIPEQAFVTATSPANTDQARLRVVVASTGGASEVHYFDRMELSSLNHGDMEDVTYATLEGFDLQRQEGNNRRLFVVRPKRNITEKEAHDLGRVIDRLKPSDARYEISTRNIDLHDPLPILGAYSDSTYWEIISKISVLTSVPNLPYNVLSSVPEEQPRPAFGGYQGEAWSYVNDLAGITASYKTDPAAKAVPSPTQRVTFQNGTTQDFAPQAATAPARLVQAGRSVSDAILLTYPYYNALGVTSIVAIQPTDPLTELFVDGIPLDALSRTLSVIDEADPVRQSSENNYWVTLERGMDDIAEEIIEIRLQRESLVNYATFEISKYPHLSILEAYDSGSGVWVEIAREEIVSSA